MITVTQASEVPDSHKIAVYDALLTHFANQIDADTYFESMAGIPDEDAESVAPETECIGISLEYDENGEMSGLFVLADIKGWADNEGFIVEVPSLTHKDRHGSGLGLDLMGAVQQNPKPM